MGAHGKPLGARGALPPGVWEVEPERSSVAFRVRHVGLSSVRGRFTRVRGTLRRDGHELRVLGGVEAASVETGDGRRDEFLRSDEFFDAERHPLLSFSCGCPPPADGESVALEGELTIRAVARPLRLTASWTFADRADRLTVQARGELSRSDYGLRFPTAGGYGDALVGGTVKILLEICALRES